MCPARKAKLTGFCYVPREGDCDVDSVGDETNICNVILNGHSLKSLLGNIPKNMLLKFVTLDETGTSGCCSCSSPVL